ncbi:MAG: DUF167 family protein [Planctomycetaceae bacterium]
MKSVLLSSRYFPRACFLKGFVWCYPGEAFCVSHRGCVSCGKGDWKLAGHFRWIGSELQVQVRISPRASRDQVNGRMGDRLKVAITAPPVDGKANAHLIAFVAKQFRVAKSQVQIVHGQTSRDKTISVQDPVELPESFEVRRAEDKNPPE